MSTTSRFTVWVSLLAGGALISACQFFSDKDQSEQKTSTKVATHTAPSKERTSTMSSRRSESTASHASEGVTQHHLVASTKATRAKAVAEAKTTRDKNAEQASKTGQASDPLSSMRP